MVWGLRVHDRVCAQLRLGMGARRHRGLAELYWLSRAQAVINLYRSTAADFIRAQMAFRLLHSSTTTTTATTTLEEGGSLDDTSATSSAADASAAAAAAAAAAAGTGGELSVCQALPLPPVIKSRAARHMIVDERLKAIYCYIPKVACTSWKLWFQQQRGRTTPDDIEHVHDADASGLDQLWHAFTESEAIRVLTRPDMFRFTFVRNPFSRVASAFRNKHVAWADPKDRLQWNKRLFGWKGARLLQIAPERADYNMTFSTFITLALATVSKHRADMEPHIAPQADVCDLDSVKYDYVGRFEQLEEGVEYVMNHLGTSPLKAFGVGKEAHRTDADAHLRGMYTNEIYEMVKGLYASDFNIPLNVEQQNASAADFQSYNGLGDQQEAAAGEYAPPAEENGTFDGGAKLPPPSQMGSEESILLREWRRKKAIELEEKARISREKHQQVLEDSKAELEAFYKKREFQVTQAKANNREKEKAYVDNLLSLNSKQGGNYWESVCAFTNFDVSIKKEKAKKKDEPTRMSTQLNDAKPGKHTDLARMRQVLLKLKHNPPPAFAAAANTTDAPAAAATTSSKSSKSTKAAAK
ncbi:unnamed protein product [Closterium sp. Yama58-4]|nr:unnamed protein product [Closterium sp. Yama58-4]